MIYFVLSVVLVLQMLAFKYLFHIEIDVNAIRTIVDRLEERIAKLERTSVRWGKEKKQHGKV